MVGDLVFEKTRINRIVRKTAGSYNLVALVWRQLVEKTNFEDLDNNKLLSDQHSLINRHFESILGNSSRLRTSVYVGEPSRAQSDP